MATGTITIDVSAHLVVVRLQLLALSMLAWLCRKCGLRVRPSLEARAWSYQRRGRVHVWMWLRAKRRP